MPGYDGTGPEGRGPLSGRGFGYCAVPADEYDEQPPRRGYGWGRGRGRGWGRGRGRGMRWRHRHGWRGRGRYSDW